ncbi:MAG: Gfo/Idh/MocA family oxidoreductase [Anaerolineae bacterium]|nr:Gfo/Idh/MocA family oxidoreductase [Anaerolineae bacterium]
MGMVSRTREVVEQVAAELAIPYAGTDWQEALTTLQPDIVAIGTPGGAHVEPILAALAQGCHVYCDKPLAVTAVLAKMLYEKAEAAGVKTAYAASYRYQPYVLLAKELVAQGAIGEPQEVECISHFNLNPLIPFGWSHQLAQGGGRLNNNFTHKLSVVEHVLGGKIMSVNGTTRSDMLKAPVVEGVHHFRTRHGFAPDSADDPTITWAEGDAEWSYTVMAKFEAERATAQPVSALFQHIALQPRFHPDHITFYGSDGTIYIEGHYGQGPLFLHPQRGEWQEMPLPTRITDAQPDIADDTQRNWNILAQEFVADIRGEGSSDYQTFKDGWIYQEVIEAVRAGDGWTDITKIPNEA